MSVRDVIQAAAGSAGDSKTYIEDVFSTYLYTGNGSTQTINNGIDLAGKGGMVWVKCRSNAADNIITDSVRGAWYQSVTNSTAAQTYSNLYLPSLNSNGFSLASTSTVNNSGYTYASWTFRKAPKFFDVVTATQTTGNTGWLTFNHNLGSVPGMIIVKVTSAADNWFVWHTSQSTKTLWLNMSNAAGNTVVCQNVTASSFDFNLTNYGSGSGATYVAYLFAHDTTTDGLIQCGSFTTDAFGVSSVNLGWEPQLILTKCVSTAEAWGMFDSMRNMSQDSAAVLRPNSSAAEVASVGPVPTATGFISKNNGAFVNSGTYIYMAIRRGPMRTPTDGTKVFSPTVGVDNTTISTGFPVDMCMDGLRTGSTYNIMTVPRLTNNGLWTSSTSSEWSSVFNAGAFANNTGLSSPNFFASANGIQWNFQRAPGFFDVVCYTGTGAVRTVNHNLGVAPELVIVKSRSRGGEDWPVLTGSGYNKFMYLNLTDASALNVDTYNCFGNGSSVTPPTTTQFTVGTQTLVNFSGATYVTYLFASCPGVSKVGSYTGNGSSQTINCGFSAGARFVLIKRTDSTGDWYAWDTARGIVSGNDPHLSLNTTAAEVTTDDTIDPNSTGFIVNQVAATNVNVSGGSYIYLAIA